MDVTNFVYSQRYAALQIGDYGTYRAQLSRQLASARKRLGRSTPKNSKYSQRAPITAEDIGGNPEFVHLILLACERARAHAMVIKATHSEDTTGKGITGQTRSHIISRLNKAVKQANELANLLSQKSVTKAADIDWLEARAYAHSLAGAEDFERHASSQRSTNIDTQRQKWNNCLKQYSAARVIYDALFKSTKKELFKDVLTGTVDPSIRYAAYQSHVPRTVPVATIARNHFPTDEASLVQAVQALDETALADENANATSADGAIPNIITWRKRKANIVDASIGQALAAVATSEDRLRQFISSASNDSTASEKAAAYDDVLTASQDAVDATRRALDDHEKEGISESDPRMQDLRVTSLAVNYGLVSWRVGRNRVLIGDDDGAELKDAPPRKLKPSRKTRTELVEKQEGNGSKLARLRERVVLYDAIMQSIDSVKELPGAAEISFREELDGKRAYFQALKCLNIAYSHALLSRHKQTLALLLKAESLSSTSLTKANQQPTLTSSEAKQLDVSPSLIQSLHTHLQNLIHHYHALVEMHNLSATSRIAAEKQMISATPIIERLNEYPVNGVDLKNLVTYPPKVQPVPVKPLFLDVAWNYIDYPGQPSALVDEESGAVAESAPPQEEKKRGWFGWSSRS